MVSYKALYPFHSQFLNVGGHRLHYLDEGKGDPILFVHGNPTWSFYYRHLIQAFQGRYRTIAPDHMGCGLSDKPEQYHYHLEQHIQNLERLVLKLDLRNITLVVHDWGGPIGIGTALRHPERFKQFVVFNTAAFLSQEMPWSLSLCRIPVFGNLMIRGLNCFSLATLRFGLHKQDRLTPEVRSGYLDPYSGYGNRVAQMRFVDDIPLNRSHPSYKVLEGIDRGLSRFRDRPALIIWGKHDFVFTTHFLNRWKKFWPQADVWLLHEAGHLVVEDCHEDIIPWMDTFLAANSSHSASRMSH